MKFQIWFTIWISLEKKFGAIVSWVLNNDLRKPAVLGRASGKPKFEKEKNVLEVVREKMTKMELGNVAAPPESVRRSNS